MKILRSYLITVFMSILIFISCSTESTTDYTLTTTVNPAESGTITPNAGRFDEGEVVTLQATPSERWVFSRWEQDLSSTANPMNITMSQNYNIVGVFERAWPIDNETAVVDVTNPATGRTWMDRNLGASRAATSPTDAQALGDLYQWGRSADGHQKKNSPTTTHQSSSEQ